MIYLCSPYSHPDPDVRDWRFVEACKAAAKLNGEGRPCFSPIAHSHPMLEHHAALGETYDSWRELDEAMIAACSEVIVLRLPGWEQSYGIGQEIKHAQMLGKPVSYLEWDQS